MKRFKSGNIPSTIEDKDDALVHFCHGPTGAVYMFIAAYKMFKSRKYLKAAADCGEVIWHRGLLFKGNGLCHGIPGNTYPFLNLYKIAFHMVWTWIGLIEIKERALVSCLVKIWRTKARDSFQWME